MTDIILTINAGSSSVKFAAFEIAQGELNQLALGQIDGIGADGDLLGNEDRRRKDASSFSTRAIGVVDHKMALTARSRLAGKGRARRQVSSGVGHRVVHGGPDLFRAVADRRRESRAFCMTFEPLAPLHQPYNLAGIEAAIEAFPDAAQVACFDTAFHRRHPYLADTFALPRHYYDEGVRRYGFHGLSYEFIARILRTRSRCSRAGRSSSPISATAPRSAPFTHGQSVASTMGFTALDGVPMGTRCGQLDPGVVLYLMAEKKMSADEITDLLYKNSGLKGMSGISHDMRELEASTNSPPRTRSPISSRASAARSAASPRRSAASTASSSPAASARTPGASAQAVLDGHGMDRHPDRRRGQSRQRARSSARRARPSVALVLQTDEERMIADHTVELLGAQAAARIRRQLNPEGMLT